MAIFIDGHVHLYSEFFLDQFFAAAFENFSSAAAKQGVSAHSQYVLALTEGGASNVFSLLYQKDLSLNDSFHLQKTAEPESLLVSKGNQTIVLIAGRQLVSKENIELLSLFSLVNIADRTLPLRDLAQRITDNKGLAVVPWGVGKWFGTREKVVADLLDSSVDFPLLCGDNGNRPLFWPEPELLRRACDSGIPLLSGSDPLPLSSHGRRPASFGSFLRHGEISMDSPASSLKQLLVRTASEKIKLESFGRRIGSLQFVSDQLRINLRNRLPGSSSAAQ